MHWILHRVRGGQWCNLTDWEGHRYPWRITWYLQRGKMSGLVGSSGREHNWRRLCLYVSIDECRWALWNKARNFELSKLDCLQSTRGQKSWDAVMFLSEFYMHVGIACLKFVGLTKEISNEVLWLHNILRWFILRTTRWSPVNWSFGNSCKKYECGEGNYLM